MGKIKGFGTFSIPKTVLDSRLNLTDVRLLSALSMRASNIDGTSFPSYDRLAKDCSTSRRGVMRAAKKLVRLNFVIKTNNKGSSCDWEVVTPVSPPGDSRVTPPGDSPVTHNSTNINSDQLTQNTPGSAKPDPVVPSLIKELLKQDENQAVNWGQVGKLLKERLKINGMTQARIVYLYGLYQNGGWWGNPVSISHFLSATIFNSVMEKEVREQNKVKEEEHKKRKYGEIHPRVKSLLPSFEAPHD